MSGTVPGQPQPTPQPAPAPVPQPGTTASAPAGFQATYNIQHPDQVINQYMRDHGVDPLNHSGAGEFMRAVMSKLVPVLLQTNFGAQGQMATDSIANPTTLLDSIFNHGTGLGANLRDFAGTALGNVQHNANLQNMSLPDMQSFLSSVNALQNFGNNPYESKANMQALQDQLGQHERLMSDYYNGRGTNPNTSLWQYINQNAGQLLNLQTNSPGSVTPGLAQQNAQAQAAQEAALAALARPTPGGAPNQNPYLPPQATQISGGLGNGAPY